MFVIENVYARLVELNMQQFERQNDEVGSDQQRHKVHLSLTLKRADIPDIKKYRRCSPNRVAVVIRRGRRGCGAPMG